MTKEHFNKPIYVIMTSMILIVGAITLSISHQEAYSAPIIEAISISDCTGDSSADGERLILTADILNFGGGDCIEIAHNNVTLDCKGFTIDGNDAGGTEGVLVTGDNVTVKNCFVEDFNIGIKYENSNRGTITKNLFSSNGQAINLSMSSNISVTSNEGTQNTTRGIALFFSSDNKVARNNFSGNPGSLGIALISSSDNTIQANTINTNDHGIALSGDSNFNKITRNEANDNTTDGVSITVGSDTNTITANNTNNNGDDGIDDSTGADAASVTNTYKRNSCSGNTDAGSEPTGLCSPQA